MNDKAVANLPSIEESAQKLAQRVKLAFVDLMTDEQVKNMVEVALKRFTEKPPMQYGKQPPSEMESMVIREIETIMKPRVSEAVRSKVWDVSMDDERLAEFVGATTPKIIEGIMVGVVKNTLELIHQKSPQY